MTNTQLQNEGTERSPISVDLLPLSGTSSIPDYSGPPLVLDTTNWIQMSPEAYLGPEVRQPIPTTASATVSAQISEPFKRCC